MGQLGHLGLTVRDIAESLSFYRDVAGMTSANQDTQDEIGGPAPGAEFFQVRSEAFGVLTNNPGSEIRFLYLRLPEGDFTLQLVEYVTGGSPETATVGHNRCGSPHLSFVVADVEQKYREVQARGRVKVTSELVQIAPNMRSFYVEDPDGVPVEFLEVQA
jgi:catechol 2,3-dioxygenase-like lactoylglutathione lyase family enzyme